MGIPFYIPPTWKKTIDKPSVPSSPPSSQSVSLPMPWKKKIFNQNKEEQTIEQQEEKIKPITKQELMRNTFLDMITNIKNRQHLSTQIGSIKPEGTYIYNDKVVSGDVLKTELQTIYKNQPSTYDYGKIMKNIKSHPVGTLYYKDDSSFIVATPEAQNVLGFYESKGYKTDEISFYKNIPRPSDVLKNIKGESTTKIIIGSESAMNLGLPFLFSGITQAVTGSNAIERQYQEYAIRGIQSLPSNGTSPGNNLLKNITSLEVISDVYIPLATIGAGYFFKPFITPALSKIGGKLAGVNTAKMIGGQYVKVNALQIAKTVGIGAGLALPSYSIISTAITNPSALPSVTGHLASNVIMMGAGFKLGEMSYTAPTSYPIETSLSLTSKTYSPAELQGKIATRTYALRGVDDPDEIFSYSTVMNWPGRTVELIGVSVPFKQTNIEVLGKDTMGIMTKTTESQYNAFSSLVFDEGKLNTLSGFSRGRIVPDVLKNDFIVSRSRGMSYMNDDVGFYRGTHVQQSFYEGESIIKGGFLEQRKSSFDMVYSRILPKEGLIVDVARVSGGPDLSMSSVIVKNVLEYTSAPSGIGMAGLSNSFSSMGKITKGYQGLFPSMGLANRVLSLNLLESMEYGLQGSKHWTSVMQSKKSIGQLSSIFSSMNISKIISSSLSGSLDASSSITGTKSMGLTSTKQLSDILTIQTTQQKQVSLTSQSMVSIPVSITGLISTPVTIGTDTGYPFVPYLPSGYGFGAGGGSTGKRRKRRGSRYRIHPVTLYDALYVNKRIAL